MLKKILFKTLLIITHLVALLVILKTIFPLIDWYLNIIPIRGTDIHLSVFYVDYIMKWQEFFRPEGWKYVWFGGQPTFLDYPSLYFLAMVPFVKVFGLIEGIMRFAVFGLIIFAFASYFFYYEISKSRTLSLTLTLAVLLSVNIYRSLIWAGGIPFWTTQAFLPLVGFLIIKFLNTRNSTWLYLGALVSGLGFLGHPQGFFLAIIPLVILLLIFYGNGFTFNSRVKNLIIFSVLFILIGLPGIQWSLLFSLLFKPFIIISSLFATFNPATLQASGSGGVFLGNQLIFLFTKSQFFVWILPLIFGFLWTLLLISKPKMRSGIKNVSPFLIYLFLYFILVALFNLGIDIFFGGWYKAFWIGPIFVAALAAAFWKQIQPFFTNVIFKHSWLIPELLFLLIALLIITPASTNHFLVGIKEESIPSRMHPNQLSKEISQDQRETLKEILLPDKLIENPNDKNKRLYVIDATFNLWWSSFFEMPLVRGYIDPPITNPQRWGLFWLDSALGPSSKNSSASLIEDWNISKEIYFENYRFLVDWNAIYYLGGNWNQVVQNSLADEATDKLFIDSEAKIRHPRPEWQPILEGHTELAQFQVLNFFKVKEELTSPIFAPNNASSVLLIGDMSAYNTIYRFLGMKNLNSQKIVAATKSEFIDDYNYDELKNFDAIILYRYSYKKSKKSWELINKYLQEGGKVYIETGTEVKESAANDLPDIFPFDKTLRGNIGIDWNITDADEEISNGIDFSYFSPLAYDGDIWNVSYPTDNLLSGAKVLLKNNGKIIAAEVKVGQGKLIWTGFNLPYHIVYNQNLEEADFLFAILNNMVDLSEKNRGNFNVDWIAPEKRIITFEKAKAILFKEQAFPTWKAKTESNKEREIYKVGPTSPGFMYIPLSEDLQSGTLELSYHAKSSWWTLWLISLAGILLSIDLIALKGFLILKPFGKILGGIMYLISKWWTKEYEE